MKDKHGDERQRTPDPSQTEAFIKRRAWVGGALIVCVLVVMGCSTVQKVLPTTAWREARVRNEGYSLLYQLLSQESDVAKILIIKHTEPAIESTVTKQLLFSTGKTFERRLLFTQTESMNYAAHLAKVLHDQENNPLRKEFLATLSQHCTVLHDRAVDLLK